MPKNHGKTDPLSSFDVAARVHLILLKSMGLAAFEGHSLSYLPTVLFSLYVHLSHVLVSSMYIWDVAASLLVSERDYDVQVIAEGVGVCGVHTRFLIMFARRARIAEMLAECRKLWTELTYSEKGIVKSFIEKSIRLATFYSGICVIFITVTQISFFMPKFNDTLPRTLPYPFYSAVQSSPWYELAAVAQILGIIGISLSGTGVDTIGPFFTMVACGHFRSLSTRLQSLDMLEASTEIDYVDKKITNCIVYHQKIIKFCNDVEKMMNVLFMTQLFSSTYNMSLCGLKLVGTDPDKLKYLSVLIILLIQLFACQWAPDVLVSESDYLTRATYFFPLSSNYNTKASKFIQMMMLRSQRPIQLTAGGFFSLSMQSFSSLVTNAMSFFTVLRSIG